MVFPGSEAYNCSTVKVIRSRTESPTFSIRVRRERTSGSERRNEKKNRKDRVIELKGVEAFLFFVRSF